MSSPFDLEGINPYTSYELYTLSRVNTKVNYNSSNLNWIFNNFNTLNTELLKTLDVSNTKNTSTISTIRNTTLPSLKNSGDRGKVIVNIKDYGAVGNGITDNLTAFNNAISALPANNGVLYIPYGDYLVSGKILIANKNRLLIKSDNATIRGNFNDILLYISFCSDANICEGRLFLKTTSTGLVNIQGLVIDNAQQNRIQNIVIEGDFTYGLNCYDNNATHYSNYVNKCIAIGCRTGFINNSSYEYTFWDGIIADNCGYGIQIWTGNVKFLNSIISRCRIGCYITGLKASNGDHGSIINNHFISNTGCGLFVDSLDYSETISGNTFIGGTGGSFTEPTASTANTFKFGIYAQDTLCLHITNNTFRNCQVGLGLDGYSISQISNNQFISDGGTITEHHIREFGETNTRFANRNTQNNICNNSFMGNLKTANTLPIVIFQSNNGEADDYSDNFGTTNSSGTSLVDYINVNSGSYYIGTKNYVVIDANVVNVANTTSTNPADQTANIYLIVRKYLCEFNIYFTNKQITKSTWIRINTTANITPIISATNLSANVVYSSTYKAIRISNVSNIKFRIRATGDGNWFITA